MQKVLQNFLFKILQYNPPKTYNSRVNLIAPVSFPQQTFIQFPTNSQIPPIYRASDGYIIK